MREQLAPLTMPDCLAAMRKRADETDDPEQRHWRHRFADDFERMMNDPDQIAIHRSLGGI